MAMDVRIDGFGTLSAGTYERISIDGFGKIDGDITCDKIDVDGVCKGIGNIEGNLMNVDGMMTIKGDIRVKELDIDGMVKTENNKIYADKIHIDGMLKNSGEVNADHVIIDGCAVLNDLFGDEIVINFAKSIFNVFSFGFGKKFEKMNHANAIECSTLRASNIKCNTICASDIVLKDCCVVDTIHCDGTLRYDSTCRIKHIEGDCIRSQS